MNNTSLPPVSETMVETYSAGLSVAIQRGLADAFFDVWLKWGCEAILRNRNSVDNGLCKWNGFLT